MIGNVPDGFPRRMFKFMNEAYVDGMLDSGLPAPAPAPPAPPLLRHLGQQPTLSPRKEQC